MPDQPTDILAGIVKLAHSLPTDSSAYAEFSGPKRRRVRAELEDLVLRLNNLAETLDQIRQPKHVFDPTSAKVIGELVANTLLLQEREALSKTVEQPFYGAGVYAIYYRGKFDCYLPISGKNHPIYVGKADPDAMHALTPTAQGARLYNRLKEHWNRSLTKASNLIADEFDCRYLVVKSAWVETAEDHLIHRFQPIWNDETRICYGFGKHGDSALTRKNERSPWDTLHPGRAWATSEDNTPNRRSVQQIKADLAGHFANTPPKK